MAWYGSRQQAAGAYAPYQAPTARTWAGRSMPELLSVTMALVSCCSNAATARSLGRSLCSRGHVW